MVDGKKQYPGTGEDDPRDEIALNKETEADPTRLRVRLQNPFAHFLLPVPRPTPPAEILQESSGFYCFFRLSSSVRPFGCCPGELLGDGFDLLERVPAVRAPRAGGDGPGGPAGELRGVGLGLLGADGYLPAGEAESGVSRGVVGRFRLGIEAARELRGPRREGARRWPGRWEWLEQEGDVHEALSS